MGSGASAPKADMTEVGIKNRIGVLYDDKAKQAFDAAATVGPDGRIHRANRNGMTSLFSACLNGHVDAARLLLVLGAESNRAGQDGQTPLFAACSNGHVDAARLLLDRGVEVDRTSNWREMEGATPLMVATLGGHTDLMRLLLERGADLEQVDVKGQTALLFACCNGHIDAARLLLGRGADVTRAATSGPRRGMDALTVAKHMNQVAVVTLVEEHFYPLLAAAKAGDIDVMSRLLDGGAAVDQAKGDGTTALLVACEHGHVDAARLLLENGAEVDRAEETYGKTPLFVACCKGHVDVARLLLDKGADITQASKFGVEIRLTPLDAAKNEHHDAVVALLEEHLDSKFPLHAAARTGDIDVMTQLLDGGAEVDTTKDGATPLFVACEHGHVEAARLLLDNDVEVDRADKWGNTPLFTACHEGHVDAATLLLDKGAAVDRAKEDGQTPLYIACEKGHVEAARLLLENGAEVDRGEETYGATPLIVGCICGHVDVARLLLDKGADITQTLKNGATPLDTAKNAHHDAVVALLEEQLDLKFPLHAAARTGDVDVYGWLHSTKCARTALLRERFKVGLLKVLKALKGDSDFLYAAPGGITALHLAIGLEYACLGEECIESLLACGCDPDASLDDSGDRPVHLAARHNPNALKPLLQGVTFVRRPGDDSDEPEPEASLAAPNARNFKGESPLDIAVRMRYVSSVALLLQGGADPNVLDADGDTPLAKAEYDQINFGGWAISTLLKDHGALALIPEEPYDEDHWTSHWEKCCTRASDRGLDDDVEESVLEPLPPDVARRRHTIR